jgi:hypothetical protein
MQQLLGTIYGNRNAMADIVQMNAGSISPREFFSTFPASRGRRGWASRTSLAIFSLLVMQQSNIPSHPQASNLASSHPQ